jgi:O-methyltransferase involved in polyketide biosynthesis
VTRGGPRAEGPRRRTTDEREARNERPSEEGRGRGQAAREAQGNRAQSNTAQVVALTRASFDRPHTPGGDPLAQRRLCRGMRPVSAGDFEPSLAARTKFFDERVLDAIGAGVRQVVILGAGYDDRALRFPAPGVRFFELDHPATQADKGRRLRTTRTMRTVRVLRTVRAMRTMRAMRTVGAVRAGAGQGPVLAPADFRHDDLERVLAACGHDATQPTLFLCEGLLVYLDQPTCVRLLAGLRARAAGGSTLAASLSVHREGLDSAHVAEVANARRRAGRTEPWLTILPAPAHLDLLRQTGWSPAESIDAASLHPGATPGRSLLVTAHPAPE